MKWIVIQSPHSIYINSCPECNACWAKFIYVKQFSVHFNGRLLYRSFTHHLIYLLFQATGGQLATLIQSLCTITVSLLIAFIFGWKLACVVAAFLPLIVISTIFQRRMAKDALKGNRKAVEGGGKVGIIVRAISS